MSIPLITKNRVTLDMELSYPHNYDGLKLHPYQLFMNLRRTQFWRDYFLPKEEMFSIQVKQLIFFKNNMNVSSFGHCWNPWNCAKVCTLTTLLPEGLHCTKFGCISSFVFKMAQFLHFCCPRVQLLGMMVSEDRDIQCNPLFPKDTQ